MQIVMCNNTEFKSCNNNKSQKQSIRSIEAPFISIITFNVPVLFNYISR